MIVDNMTDGKRNCVAHATACINDAFAAFVGNESFYHFCGKLLGINLLEMIHPDYVDEFKDAYFALKEGESVRFFLRIKSAWDEYVWADVVLTDKARVIEGQEVKDIELFFLTAVESRYIQAINNVNKYRTQISMYQNYLFDYDVKENIFTIYKFTGNQSNSLVKGDFDEICNRIRQRYNREKDIKNFEKFVSAIKMATQSYKGSVCLPLDNEFSKIKRFKVNSSVVYTQKKFYIVTGVLEPSEEDDEENTIPYYETQEALDPATGLLNKRASYEYSVATLEKDDGEPHYMIVFDVDNFKSINDNYGHYFGDDVLQKVANIVSRAINGRGITGRFGGDEFYIFTNNIKTEDELRVILTTMRKDMLYAYEGINDDVKVTISVGVSLYPKDGKTYEELFKKADKCVYIAKNKGRNRFIIYNDEMHSDVVTDEQRIHKALNIAEHDEYLAAFFAERGIEIVNNGRDSVPQLLKDMREQFDIDGVRIYCEDSPEPLFVEGDYKQLPDMSSVLKDDDFYNAHNRNGILMAGTITSLDGKYKLSDIFSVSNIMATVSLFKVKDGKRYVFFYDVFNHTNRWNDVEKNYMLMLSTLITAVI